MSSPSIEKSQDGDKPDVDNGMRNAPSFVSFRQHGIVAGGAFGAEIAIKDVNNYEVRECSSFFVPLDLISGDNLELSQSQTSMIERAETAFPKMVASRKSYGVTFVEPKAERNDQVASSEKDDFSDIPF